MNKTTIFLAHKLYNLAVLIFFMGGATYLIVKDNWSVWTLLIAFILCACFMSDLRLRTNTTIEEKSEEL
jgi:hypothetical protein